MEDLNFDGKSAIICRQVIVKIKDVIKILNTKPQNTNIYTHTQESEGGKNEKKFDESIRDALLKSTDLH